MSGSVPEPLLPTPVAIDGPAASGKSSVGEALARRHGYAFLDTGLMYRAFALAAVRAGVSAADEDACAALARALDMRVETAGNTRVFFGGEDVTGELRTPPVEDSVSDFSRIEAVRAVMVERQRAIAARGGVLSKPRRVAVCETVNSSSVKKVPSLMIILVYGLAAVRQSNFRGRDFCCGGKCRRQTGCGWQLLPPHVGLPQRQAEKSFPLLQNLKTCNYLLRFCNIALDEDNDQRNNPGIR